LRRKPADRLAPVYVILKSFDIEISALTGFPTLSKLGFALYQIV
jgi:hypothetical protein